MIASGVNMDLLLDLAPQVLSRLASHTSGSTGKPKGVVHDHASVASRALQRSSAMNIDSNTHALQFGTYTFIISTFEIFTTLIFGGYLCMPRDYDCHPFLQSQLGHLNPDFARCLRRKEVLAICFATGMTVRLTSLVAKISRSRSVASSWSLLRSRLIYALSILCAIIVTSDAYGTVQVVDGYPVQ